MIIAAAAPRPRLFAKRCGDALALEHNGDFYSCDHYVEPEHLLGNIREQHADEVMAWLKAGP